MTHQPNQQQQEEEGRCTLELNRPQSSSETDENLYKNFRIICDQKEISSQINVRAASIEFVFRRMADREVIRQALITGGFGQMIKSRLVAKSAKRYLVTGVHSQMFNGELKNELPWRMAAHLKCSRDGLAYRGLYGNRAII